MALILAIVSPSATVEASATAVSGGRYEAEEIGAPASRTDRSDDVDPRTLPVSGAARAGAARLVLAIDALAELGVFGRHPLPPINGAVGSIRTVVPSDGLGADGYRTELRRLAADLAPLIDHLADQDVAVGEPLENVLATASDDTFLDDVDSGASARIDPGPWVSAAADLLLRAGAEPDDPADRRQDVPAVLALAESLAAGAAVPAGSTATAVDARARPAPTGGREVASDGDGSSLPPALVIGVLAVVAGLVAAALVGRGRRSSRVGPDRAPGSHEGPDPVGPGPVASVPSPAPGAASLEHLLDISRRLTSSLDETEVAGIAVTEARRLVDAEGGLIAVRSEDGLRVLGNEPPALFDLDRVADGGLRRVIDTGRPMIQIAHDEPALVEVPMALAAIPVVADGVVAGFILVVRVPSRPFARDELDGLEMLAPLLGSALRAAEAHGSAAELADIDPLSGLKNRRRLAADLHDGDAVPLATLMIDIDHFKNFNDANGHAAGDHALRQVAALLAENVRPDDVVYRYGGEEFCVLLADTSPEEARHVAERIRAAIEAAAIPGGENQPAGRVTVSVGVAGSEPGTHDEVIERADAALYEAKRGGRNRVCIAP